VQRKVVLGEKRSMLDCGREVKSDAMELEDTRPQGQEARSRSGTKIGSSLIAMRAY